MRVIEGVGFRCGRHEELEGEEGSRLVYAGSVVKIDLAVRMVEELVRWLQVQLAINTGFLRGCFLLHFFG